MTKATMLRTLRTTLLSSIIALTAIFLLTFTVSARTVSLTKGVHPTQPAATTVKIVKRTGGYNFMPNKITIKTGSTVCGDNTTSITQTVTFNGSTFASIPAHKTVCKAANVPPGTYIFGLKSNPKAKLTVTVTS